MRIKLWIVVVAIVAIVGLLWWNGNLTGAMRSSGSRVDVVAGWNEFVVPSVWADTTAQGLITENPSIVTVSCWENGAWTSYTPGAGDADFNIHSGMVLKVYVTGAGELVSY